MGNLWIFAGWAVACGLPDPAGGVRKSALVMQFSQNIFLKQYDPTIEDVHSCTVEHEGKRCRLHIIDTAGIEQFGIGVSKHHIQRGVGFVLVFSLTQKTSLMDLEYIRKQIYQIKNGDEDIPMVVVGTKMDLRHEREVSSETIQDMAMKWGVPFYETSAKRGWDSNKVFHYLLGRMHNKYPGGEPKGKKGRRVQCVIM